MIAVDLDGTLLASDGSVSARTRDVLDGLVDSSWPLVITSARPLRDVRRIPELSRSTVLICGNGTLVHDPRRGVDLWRHTIPGTVLRSVLTLVRTRFPTARFGYDAHPELVLEDGFRLAPGSLPATRSVSRLDTAPDTHEVGKLLIQLPGDATDHLAPLRALGLRGIEVTCSSTGFCEVTATGVTKASALTRVADRLGYRADEVIAFGDMPNDLPMLNWAGCAVAVGNAHESVLAAAGHVTTSNDDDGVARFLEDCLAGRPPDSNGRNA
ncbi:HAD family hydrolase [Saccharomonospora iraqiensis]|uniref:HAD family hydrolase n=1 Tax=Saccharomonospora iraqiensis TaxID=52698 RepID=UPI0006878856|nr:Cof-type HAD-IIB family hydrolase [Saccharomonospora iraqiensis]